MSKDYSLKDLEELEKKQKKIEQRVMTGTILVLGICGVLINWYFAITKGMYNGLLAYFSPAVIIGAIYLIFFPNDFSNQSGKKLSFRMWAAIIIGVVISCAHLIAFEYGL